MAENSTLQYGTLNSGSEVPAHFEYFARLSLLGRPREDRGTVITMPVKPAISIILNGLAQSAGHGGMRN